MTHQQPVIHGWLVLAHARFLDQFESLVLEVEKLKGKDPGGYQKKSATKRLEAIVKLAFDQIPQDPTKEIYRQGKTLGEDNKHWFRAKFYQQYRLFFRYRLENKIIVLGWVNDPATKRAYDSKTDAYKVFQSMIEGGNPPNGWRELLESALAEGNRLETAIDNLIDEA